jgi:membrane dipeptidase
MDDARALLEESEAVDLHVESFVWTRALGYDLTVAHDSVLFGGAFQGQADLPRLRRAGLAGSVQSIATQPLFTGTGRLLANVERLRAAVDAATGCRVVSGLSCFEAARRADEHACFLAVQGGNAFDEPGDVERVPDRLISRVTLVHLTDSYIGRSSNPLGGIVRSRGLTSRGEALVEALNAQRVLVDLAHISEAGFYQALDAHDPHLPPIVSHSAARGVHDIWRNVSDDQIRAIAERGGVVGVFFHSLALAPIGRRVDPGHVVEHMTHVIDVGGEGCAALGTDYDGLIVPPRGLRTVDRLHALVSAMLEAGWSERRIRNVLGGNYLRVLADVRP